MGRRATKPIPDHLVGRFFDAVWMLAIEGRYVDAEGVNHRYGRNAFMRRRHALCVLWMTQCALRFSELQRLRIDDVSATGCSAWVQRSKGGKSGDVDVSAALIELTSRWRSTGSQSLNHSPWLIPSNSGTQLDNNAFNRDCCGYFQRIFGVRLTSHCFRDTACQLAYRQSGQVQIVQRLLGHRSAQTTEHYLAKQRAESFRLELHEPKGVA